MSEVTAVKRMEVFNPIRFLGGEESITCEADGDPMRRERARLATLFGGLFRIRWGSSNVHMGEGMVEG